jgi:hypothetical protein
MRRCQMPTFSRPVIYPPEAKAASCLYEGHESDKLTQNVTDVGHILDSCPSEFTDSDAQ